LDGQRHGLGYQRTSLRASQNGVFPDAPRRALCVWLPRGWGRCTPGDLPGGSHLTGAGHNRISAQCGATMRWSTGWRGG